ncbi:hypothetical protein MXB_666 [Myxobolus squamalis]|nr:hypothetical protein MXB_666 [Myxobolus squamalis]
MIRIRFWIFVLLDKILEAKWAMNTGKTTSIHLNFTQLDTFILTTPSRVIMDPAFLFQPHMLFIQIICIAILLRIIIPF